MRTILRGFIANEVGVTAIEYGLIAALMSAVILTALTTTGTTLNTTLNTIATSLR